MKEAHLTLRIPADLARALARWARRQGVPKSQVARDAVARYLGPTGSSDKPTSPVTARMVAAQWASVPRLGPHEARALADDLTAARKSLPAIPDPWA